MIAVNVEITAAAAARAAIRFMATSILPPRVTRQPSIILPAPQILRRFCLRTPGSYGTRLHSRPTAQPASAGPATPYLAAGCASDRRQPAPARGVGHRRLEMTRRKREIVGPYERTGLPASDRTRPSAGRLSLSQRCLDEVARACQCCRARRPVLVKKLE